MMSGQANGGSAPVVLEQVLDPAWLQQALYPSRPDVRVEAVDVVWTLSNTATKIRAVLTLSGDCGDVPPHICIKGMLGEKAQAYLPSGVSAKEVRFYQELAGPLSAAGMNLPTMIYGAIDPANNHGLFIMEDLVAEGCEFLSPLTPYSRDEALASLAQLARLHAETSPDSAHHARPWIESTLEQVAERSMVPVERLQVLLQDGRSDAFPAALRDATQVHGALGLLAERLRGAARSCIHGDAHAGNLFRTADGGIGVIDWQLIQRGCWAQDVAYHLGTALSVEARRDSERELLDHYLDRLAAYGGPRIDREGGWAQYRMGMLYGYYLWGITQRVDRSIIEELIHRLGTAVVDLDSFALVAG